MRAVLKMIAKMIFCSAVTWLCYRYFRAIDPKVAPIGLAIGGALCAYLCARDILNAIVAIKYHADRKVLQPWEGRYYHFDRHHLRFYFQDELIWIPEKDLKALLQPRLSERELRLLGSAYAPLRAVKEMAVSEAGLLTLLKSRTEHRRADYQMIRFKRWLNHEALPNVRRLPRSAASA